MYPVQEALKVECADGENMPYLGYICTTIEPNGMPLTTLQDCLFLIVPRSNYNSRVPVLIGTNIILRLLEVTREEYGARYLQDADLHTSWYLAFRCMALRDRGLQRNENRLSILKSAETDRVIIPPNGCVVINGYMDRKLPYHQVLAMLQATKRSSIPTDLDITPSLHLYDYDSGYMVPVEISNITTRTVSISPKAILCELQPVTVLDTVLPESATTTPDVRQILDQVNISKDVTIEEQNGCKDLISEFSDIFSKSSTDIGTTDKVKHRIDLHDDTPFKQKYRRIPPAMVEEVRAHIQELIASGVIRPSHSQFSSNVVLLKKQEKMSQKGSKYAFLQLSDPTGIFEVTLFSEMLAAAREHLEPGNALLLGVEAEQREDQIRFTCTKIEPLDGALENKIREISIHMDQGAPIHKIKEFLDEKGAGHSMIKLHIRVDSKRIAEVQLPGRWSLSADARNVIRTQEGVQEILEG